LTADIFEIDEVEFEETVGRETPYNTKSENKILYGRVRLKSQILHKYTRMEWQLENIRYLLNKIRRDYYLKKATFDIMLTTKDLKLE